MILEAPVRERTSIVVPGKPPHVAFVRPNGRTPGVLTAMHPYRSPAIAASTASGASERTCVASAFIPPMLG